jgi:hypothetical protein
MNINTTQTAALDLLRHRMQSVAIGHLAISHTLLWESVPHIKIYFDELQVIEGNALAFTNPAIEAALVHCRALLEFLGLSASDEKSLNQRKSARNDDIVIELFSGPTHQLQKITVAEATSPYSGDPAEAEHAFAYVLHTTNKGLAHTTSGFSKSDDASHLLEIAFRGVHTLMVNYFYNRLGIEPPDYEIKSRRRDA